MEYQKTANLLNNKLNQPSKFRTRNSVETNDESSGTYTNTDIKFKTTMLRSNYVIMQMHTYLLKEQYQLLEQEMMMLQDN